MPEAPVRTGLIVLLVLVADLEVLILLEPTAWVTQTVITMTVMAVLIVRIVRALMPPRKEKQ
jgi:hypothetical protein